MRTIKTIACLGIAIVILSSLIVTVSCTSEMATVSGGFQETKTIDPGTTQTEQSVTPVNTPLTTETTTTTPKTTLTTPPVTNKTTIPQLSFFEVEITEDGLFPDILTIPIGSMVTWFNTCAESRQIVSKMPLTINSDDLRPYQSWSFTFIRLGTFRYSEIMGSTMGASDGTIIVK